MLAVAIEDRDQLGGATEGHERVRRHRRELGRLPGVHRTSGRFVSRREAHLVATTRVSNASTRLAPAVPVIDWSVRWSLDGAAAAGNAWTGSVAAGMASGPNASLRVRLRHNLLDERLGGSDCRATKGENALRRPTQTGAGLL